MKLKEIFDLVQMIFDTLKHYLELIFSLSEEL